MNYLQYEGQLYSIVTGDIVRGTLWIPVEKTGADYGFIAIVGWFLFFMVYYKLERNRFK